MANDPYRSTDFSLSLADRIRVYFQSLTKELEYHGYEALFFQHIQLESYSESSRQVVYRLVVPQALCNKDGNLHGGAVSTLFDNLSSTSLFTISKPGFWDNMGVSRSLYVVFHRAVPLGTEVTITASVVAVGRRMATVKAEMRNAKDKILYASCMHEKFGAGDRGKI